MSGEKSIYRGLTKSFHVTPGPRTDRSAERAIPFLQRVFSGTQQMEIETDKVYPYSPKRCFDLTSDYREYLLMILKDNENEAKKELDVENFFTDPRYLGDRRGSVGSRVAYAYYLDKRVYHRIDRVTDRIEGGKDPDGNEFFKFVVHTEQIATLPSYPMREFTTVLIFTRFQKDPNQCHVRSIRRWVSPSFGEEAENMKAILQDRLERELFRFKLLAQTTYTPKIPKKDSKVLVIGAGPSGLHMSYELIQRGLPPENITILEKTDRYGGKTRSEHSTDVQVSNAVYNHPVNGLVRDNFVKWLFDAFSDAKIAVKLTGYSILHPAATKADLLEYERTLRVGALQAQKEGDYFVDGEEVYHEMGTCYLSPSYYMVRKLLREVQDKVEEMAASEGNRQDKWSRLAALDITREVYPDSYAIEQKVKIPFGLRSVLSFFGLWKEPEYYDMESWLQLNVVNNSNVFLRFLSRVPLVSMFFTFRSLKRAKSKYCYLHEELMGFYQFGFPPMPDEGKMEKLSMSLATFMKENHLLDLEPLFAYALTAQGYGLLSKTPTYMAMQWLTPDLLDGYLEWFLYFSVFYKDSAGNVTTPIPKRFRKFDNGQKAMLVSGWGALWDRIVELYDLKNSGRLKLEATLKSIKRENGKVYASYEHKGETFDEEFDFLVLGASLSDAANDPQLQLPDLPLDTTPEEKKFLLSEEWEASIFKTNVFRPNSNGKYSENHIRIFAKNLVESIAKEEGEDKDRSPGQGQVFATRDSYKAVQPGLSTKYGDKFDPRGDLSGELDKTVKNLPRERMCYQYISPSNLKNYPNEKARNEFLQAEYEKFFKGPNGEGADFNGMEHIEDEAWTYYTHYGIKGVKECMPWHLASRQGLNNTYFVHASASFESVLDISNYNVMLLDGLSGRLDSYIRPPSDPRPMPQERPWRLIVQGSLQSGFLHLVKPFFSVVDNLLYLVYGAFYCLSYPFYEAYFARTSRKQLQENFLTPGVKDIPWTYFDMKGFLKVSPSVRGFYEVYDPKEADHPDSIFAELETEGSAFLKRQPTVPKKGQVTSSIEWNLTDTRQALRHWLYGIEETFSPFAFPYLRYIPGVTCVTKKVFLTMQAKFPNLFGWVYSIGFAFVFRNIVGFAYRFSDELGGGVKIDDCHMLRVAREEYGTRVGQKFCFTVCKVFTEEAMRKHKVKLDFQPDFLTGSGNGCTVRIDSNVEQAFSDNEIDRFRTKKDQERFKEVGYSW